MDDIIIGGLARVVVADVTVKETEGALKGLILNEKKCEAISQQSQTIEPVLQQFIQLTVVKSVHLGVPLSKGLAMDSSLSSQCNDQEKASSRLGLITAHDALGLLCVSFSAFKLQHIVHASPRYDMQL